MMTLATLLEIKKVDENDVEDNGGTVDAKGEEKLTR